ncbi:MAG: FKBP-type peptidyl-prolyl cis-trans isomerase [Candidatus Babeliales bacterium]
MKRFATIIGILGVCAAVVYARNKECCKRVCSEKKQCHVPQKKTGTEQMKRVKTDSGLSYEIIQKGAGASPKVGQMVTVHYTGWLDNNGEKGTQFDSSVDRGTPFVFKIGVGQVIAGWDEGVMSMEIGEKRRLFIPADLGYGARGAGRVIPPHAGLIFDVELIKIG